MSPGRWAQFQTRVSGAAGQPVPEALPRVTVPVDDLAGEPSMADWRTSLQQAGLQPQWSGWQRRPLPPGWTALVRHAGMHGWALWTLLAGAAVIAGGVGLAVTEGSAPMLALCVLLVVGGGLAVLAQAQRAPEGGVDAAVKAVVRPLAATWPAAMCSLALRPFVALDGGRLVDGRGPAERSLAAWEGWLRECEHSLTAADEELAAGLEMTGALAGREGAALKKHRRLDDLRALAARTRDGLATLRKEVAWTRRELAEQDDLVARGDAGGFADADLRPLYLELAAAADAFEALQRDFADG